VPALAIREADDLRFMMFVDKQNTRRRENDG
jgi:hypothetical protein